MLLISSFWRRSKATPEEPDTNFRYFCVYFALEQQELWKWMGLLSVRIVLLHLYSWFQWNAWSKETSSAYVFAAGSDVFTGNQGKGCVLRRQGSYIPAAITTHHSLTWSLLKTNIVTTKIFMVGLQILSQQHDVHLRVVVAVSVSQCSILHYRTCDINPAGVLWGWVGFGPKAGQFAAWLIAALAQSYMLAG